ncbi:leucine-rich repeat domain-containing protein [Chryseobacterium sp.]|uniref:leucine-rich repeat domain-containing protein n=1 Tax=Chryseobacterium sp. TaxID=1871047 RepID=UPI00289EA3F8|nr:leucine-rich repeat domain-containing protein [Chryseobacterium sp.]
MKTKEELKLYFENGDKPTQEQFWEWMDSYWHKNEKISRDSIDWVAQEQFLYSPTDSTELIGISKTIIIPEGTKVIGASSFNFVGIYKNYITKVIFPKSLEKIKSGAFSLQHLSGSLRIPGNCKTIEARTFNSSTTNISELILEEGIENIGIGAFQLSGNTTLSDLYIPNSIQSLGQDAFAIPSLKTVSAPKGLDLRNAGIPETAIITYR